MAAKSGDYMLRIHLQFDSCLKWHFSQKRKKCAHTSSLSIGKLAVSETLVSEWLNRCDSLQEPPITPNMDILLDAGVRSIHMAANDVVGAVCGFITSTHTHTHTETIPFANVIVSNVYPCQRRHVLGTQQYAFCAIGLPAGWC